MKTLQCKSNNVLLSQYISDNSTFGYFKIKKLIANGEVKVNGKRTRQDVGLTIGDEIVVYADEQLPQLEVVFQDENVLFVNKPVGVEVLGDKSLESMARLVFGDQNINACNRLDRNTTGIVCFAKNSKSYDELLRCFKHHLVDKTYHAMVYGVPKQKQAKLTAFLFKNAKQSKVFISSVKKEGYLPIETHYKVIDNFGNHSKLEIGLVTGRTHQIRAHMASIGHPVLGDGKYSTNEINKKFDFKTQALCAVEYKFKFENSSYLSYLNNKTIKIKAPF